MGYKRCSCCKEEKVFALFSKNASRKDGLHPSCKECKNKGNNKYHLKNREKEAVYSKQYYQSIGKFQTIKQRELAARRRASKLKATPKWLSKSQLEAIKCKYSLAGMFTKNSGIDYVVDHIVPLRGKTVCGLHVPWNLQIITAKDNWKKGNKLEGDTADE
jgi:5-methylcytosine-specific restriction endonuclease McrA